MKELFFGLMTLVLACIVSVLMITLGTVYSLGYSIWLSVTGKDWTAFFKFWWRMLDGYCAAIGHLLYSVGYTLDMTWNVNGEIIEDIVTTDEFTAFSQKNITVSASIGNEEIKGKLTPWGKRISTMLNIVFNQQHHAIGAWKYLIAKKKIEAELFKPLREE